MTLDRRGGRAVTVEVWDNGVGFDTAAPGLGDVGDGRGFGLVAGRERLAAYGGRLTVDSTPGRGTRVLAATVRILIVDDHAVVRAGLIALLDGEPGFAVVGETGDGMEAARLAQQLWSDVVMMDLRLTDGTGSGEGEGGIETTRRITAAVPGVRVVVLTSYLTQGDVVGAMEVGARGYVLKAGPPEELFRAVRTAATGGPVLAPDGAERLVAQVSDPGAALSERETEVVGPLGMAQPHTPRPPGLTERGGGVHGLALEAVQSCPQVGTGAHRPVHQPCHPARGGQLLLDDRPHRQPWKNEGAGKDQL
ncbi:MULTISPECIES: helix-turn-helix transcriptional regulator [Streptomyces]|uniref:response regulator n=1 Tax=Streptomyces TaxID=1883 RepID=UPI0012FEE262